MNAPALALERALASRHTRASFATLTKHRNAGRYDRLAAIRLLLNNVRDTGVRLTLDERDACAKALLAHWRNTQRSNRDDDNGTSARLYPAVGFVNAQQ